jgi:hypothetical protein
MRSQKDLAMIKATTSFQENLQLLPPIAGLVRIDLIDSAGHIAGTIANEPGKMGSLAVYHYLSQNFAALTVDAARLGLALFAEHTKDAENRPGVHPNIDRLLDIAGGAAPLTIKLHLAD